MLPPPAPVVVVHLDYGGQIGDFQARVSEYAKRRVRVRIEGECDSACTLVLGLPRRQVCAGPKARFGFHQAYNGNRFDPSDTTIRNDVGTEILMQAYPPEIRMWIDGMGGLTADMVWLEGDELRGIVRPCR